MEQSIEGSNAKGNKESNTQGNGIHLAHNLLFILKTFMTNAIN